MKFSIFIVILCFSSNDSRGIDFEDIANRVINSNTYLPELKATYEIVGNLSTNLFSNLDGQQFDSLSSRIGNTIISLNDQLAMLLQTVVQKTKNLAQNFSSILEVIQNSGNETLIEYVRNWQILANIYKKTLTDAKSWYGVSLFVNNCELNAVYDYPAKIREDLLSDDSNTIRHQILKDRDAGKYARYVKFMIPLFYTALKYEALCRAIKNDTISEVEIQTVSAAIQNQVKVDIAALSKDYFKRAIDDAKKEIVEQGSINLNSCKQIYSRLKANYFFANWTVGIYCKDCSKKNTRLVPEYYKTSNAVYENQEYVFKGDGGKENYFQVWPEGKYYVFLASAVGGRNSRDDWRDRMSMCVDLVEKTKVLSKLFESDNEQRMQTFKSCVERLKVTNFSMLGITESEPVACVEYDLAQSVAKALLNKFTIFAIDKMRA